MGATLQQRFIAALAARGSTIVPNRSKKYVQMTRSDRPAATTYYFVGKAGALRFGASVSRTYPVSDAFKKKLLNGEALPAGQPESLDLELHRKHGERVAEDVRGLQKWVADYRAASEAGNTRLANEIHGNIERRIATVGLEKHRASIYGEAEPSDGPNMATSRLRAIGFTTGGKK